MNKYHDIKRMGVNEGKIEFELEGEHYSFELDNISEKLKNATDDEKLKFELSPSGYGIQWPLIDEDISIDGLIGKKNLPKQNKISA